MYKPQAIRIFLIEDNPDLLELLKISFEEKKFSVKNCYLPEKILQEIYVFKPHLIIIDIDLDATSGWGILRILKQDKITSSIRKIVISGKYTQSTHIVHALNDFEVDDYVVKPFGIEILLAKANVLLKRSEVTKISEHKNEIIRCGKLKIDKAKMVVSINNKVIKLTNMEVKLLIALAEKKDFPQTRDYLLERVFEYREPEVLTRTVDKHIQLLRKKLKHYGKRIVTIPGVGYKFVSSPTKYA